MAAVEKTQLEVQRWDTDMVQTFGEWFRELRCLLDLSVPAMAERLGVSPQQVSNLCARITCSPGTAWNILHGLGFLVPERFVAETRGGARLRLNIAED